MGKTDDQHQIAIPESEAEILCPRAAGIRRAFSPRCVVVLILSVCVFLSALFWLPPFRSLHSGSLPDESVSVSVSAKIKATFILKKPMSLLVDHRERLEYDIFEDIGIPNTKVSLLSMHPAIPANSTSLVFGVLPDPECSPISLPALSVLRSSLIGLVLQELNLSLTPSIFGRPSSFEILSFPIEITLIPDQTASIWERTHTLFDFKLNNSINQIQRSLDELKDQLKFGLNLKYSENVYVQLTNKNGSTVAPPVIVKASVLSDFGSRNLQPDRLKQLAEVITGSHDLGLNHAVFGKVNYVQLSAYLRHSISSVLSPSPSPSPSPTPTPSPSPSEEFLYPTLSPSYAPDHYPSPSGSPLSHNPIVKNGPQPPTQSMNSPGPSVTVRHTPLLSPSYGPITSPTKHPYPPASDYLPNLAPSEKPPRQTPQIVPRISPPTTSYAPSSQQDKGGGKASISPMAGSSQIAPSPSPSSNAAISTYMEFGVLGLLGFLVFQLVCGPYY